VAAQADKRRRIMRAVEKLFKSRRVHEIAMDEVARLAGVGKGTIYTHFKDKDDLFFRTATAGFDDLCDFLRRNVPREVSFPEQLLRACTALDEFFKSRRQLLRMMQTEEGRMFWFRGAMRSHFMAQRRKLVDAMAEIVRRGVAEGAIRHDLSPEVLTHLLLGMSRTRAQAMSELPGKKLSCNDLVDLFCHGAGPTSRRAT